MIEVPNTETLADGTDYSLVRLVQVAAACSQYAALDGAGQQVDLRIVHPPWLAAVGQDVVGRRLRMAALVRHPHVQTVLDVDLQRPSPRVVLEYCPSNALRAQVEQRRLSMPEIVQIGIAMVQAVRECHRLGFVVGVIAPECIHSAPQRNWLLDVTGLFLPAFAPGWSPGSLESPFVPPEYAHHPGLDSFGDSFSLAALLRWLCDFHDQSDSARQRRLLEQIQDALLPDPFQRPTMDELASRLDDLQGTPKLSSGASFPAAGSALDATMVISGEVATATATDPRLDSRLPMPKRLGRFLIDRKLGEGGMGAVYCGRDELDETIVAIKVLANATVRNSTAIRRLAKEARALAQANNPNVTNLLEFNTDGETAFLAVEYVAGGALGDILVKGQPMPERVAIALAADIARGLSVAHQRGIVHRDIKPDNVLLTLSGRQWLDLVSTTGASHVPIDLPPEDEVLAKLADFGLARFDSQSESLAITREGSLLGTPKYMSPEQCRGETAAAQSDVYSLGITLFELVSGQCPFDSESHAGMMHKHCHEPPPNLQSLRPGLSDSVVRVVEKCLAKNADARYSDAAHLLIDLDNLLRGEPTSLGLHPPILAVRQPGVLRFEYSWDLQSSPAALWPFVSNTDRVNHALGLPAVKYTVRTDPIHGVERTAETVIVGQTIRWREHPYEWIEGKRLSVFREFLQGPFHWFVNVVELARNSSGGTRLTQTFQVLPKNWLGGLLARLQLGKKARLGFGKAYREVDEYLTQGADSQPERDPFGRTTDLSRSKRARLEQRLQPLRVARIDPRVVDTLAQYLEHGSDLDVARIRPIALARRFQLDPQQTVSACLLGAQAGLLTLLWDILCPSCRIPANVQETLAAIQDHAYCEACDLRFELDLAKSVELIFRPHPEFRSVETRTYCIGGPAWSRHVVAQIRLAAGERFTGELELEEGAYVIRGPQLPFTIDFRARPSATQTVWNVPLSRPLSRTQAITLRERSQVINLHNDTARDQQIRIERTASREDALTAAQASSLALFREIFPDQVLSSGQMVSIAHTTVFLARVANSQQLCRNLGDGRAYNQIREILDRIVASIKENGGAIVKTIGDGVQASFVEPSRAVAAAVQLLRLPISQSELSVSAAIHAGSALVTTVDDRLDYFGATVHQALRLFEIATAREMIISDAISSQAEVAQLLQAANYELTLVDAEQHGLPLIAHRVQIIRTS